MASPLPTSLTPLQGYLSFVAPFLPARLTAPGSPRMRPFRHIGISFFFSKSVKKSVKRGVRVLRARSARAFSPQSRSLFSASFQTFCLTARAYFNTQKNGLFCSLAFLPLNELRLRCVSFKKGLQQK